MRLQLPKPAHGWRDFVGEVGIIVLGVLIALAAQQVVENIEWKQRVHEAEAAMTKELGDDDGAQASARVQISPCIARELDRAEQALIAERDRGVPFVAPALTTPPFRTWDDGAWRAAVSSQATSHMTTDRMYAWSSPYALTADMDQAAAREFNDWAELARIKTLRLHPSEEERQRIFVAIAHARQDNQFLGWMSGIFLEYIATVGVEIPQASKRDQTRRQLKAMGGCLSHESAAPARRGA